MVGFPICIPAGARRLLPARAVCSESFRSRYPYIATKGRDSGTPPPASQSKRFCRTNVDLSDKNTACSHLAMGKSVAENSVPKFVKFSVAFLHPDRLQMCRVTRGLRGMSACGRHADLLCLVAETEECICTRWNSTMINRYLARIISVAREQSHSFERTFFLES